MNLRANQQHLIEYRRHRVSVSPQCRRKSNKIQHMKILYIVIACLGLLGCDILTNPASDIERYPDIKFFIIDGYDFSKVRFNIVDGLSLRKIMISEFSKSNQQLLLRQEDQI